MYAGKQPLIIISTLVGLLVVVGVVLVFLGADDEFSALTGSTVIPFEEEATPSLLPSAPQGSVSRPFDAAGQHFVDFSSDEELRLGDYMINIVHVKTQEKVGDYFNGVFQGKEAAKQYYVVQMYVTNFGTKEEYLDPTLFTLSDGAVEYLIDKEGTKHLFESSIYYPVLRSGMKRLVKFAFDVEPGRYFLFIHGDRDTIFRMKVEA